MKRKHGVNFAAILAVILFETCLSALPTLEHISDTALDLATGNAVSSRGSVIVGQAVDWSGPAPEEKVYHFFKSYDVTSETITDLGAMSQGGRAFRATAISGDGTVVSGITQGGVAYRWVPGTGATEVNWSIGNVTDISNDGSVIIGTSGPFAGIIYIWDSTGTTTVETPSIPESNPKRNYSGIPYGINGPGTIVVGSLFDSQGTEGEAFIYADDTLIPIGKLEGDASAAALDVNADGTVVVGFSQLEFRKLAFFYRDGKMFELDHVGYPESEAIGISGDGAIIVGHVKEVQESGFQRWHVAIWQRQSADSYSLTLVNDLFGDTESSLKTATAISEDGSTIIGTGSFNGVDGVGRLRLDVTPWAGAAVDALEVNPIVLTVVGTTNVQFDPWWYSYTLESYIYATDDAEEDSGSWIFVPAPAGP